MEIFRYREELKDINFPKFKEITISTSVYNLASVFLLECLIRIKNTQHFSSFSEKFYSVLNSWRDTQSKTALLESINRLLAPNTLVSRFSQLQKELISLQSILSNFMLFALKHDLCSKPRTRETLSQVGKLFNLYFCLNDTIYPIGESGTRLLCHFGVKDNKFLCILYSPSVISIDKSIESSIRYLADPYYYNPKGRLFENDSEDSVSTQNPVESNRVPSRETQVEKNFLHSELKSQVMSVCSQHYGTEVIMLNCGADHCLLCLIERFGSDESQGEAMECSCGYEISPKYLNLIRERAKKFEALGKSDFEEKNEDFNRGGMKLEKGFDEKKGDLNRNELKCEKSYEQDKELVSRSFKPPPSLLRPKTSEKRLDNSLYQKSELRENKNRDELFKNSEKNSYNSNPSFLRDARALILNFLSTIESTKPCSRCSKPQESSEFSIICNCLEPICLHCRSPTPQICLLCKAFYNPTSKAALEILKLTN